jgi:hypothetical protein
MISRQVLRINAASASTDAGDTGPSFDGEIVQMRWVPPSRTRAPTWC